MVACMVTLTDRYTRRVGLSASTELLVSARMHQIQLKISLQKAPQTCLFRVSILQPL